jgi:hypothetical protein
MGLDQYAYVAAKAGQDNEFWDGAELNPQTGVYVNAKVAKPREISYWRKHPNLQGWMENLWNSKHRLTEDKDTSFNGIELELTYDDIVQLEDDVNHGRLPSTTGFFFGNNSDADYKEQDLEFCRNAKAELFLGLKVFYNSSW